LKHKIKEDGDIQALQEQLDKALEKRSKMQTVGPDTQESIRAEIGAIPKFRT